MQNVALVFLGGGIGAAGRWLLQGVVQRWTGSAFPLGTLAVNISGCFLIGFLLASGEGRIQMTPSLRLFLAVGILGGFTTFSSFSFETLALFRDGEALYGMLNAGGSLLGCLAATYAGSIAGKLL